MRILGLDYGEARTGVAISDALGITAQGVESIEHSENMKKLIERLEKQKILLSNASISTMHSFCQNLIRQNFAVLDLDPAFRAGHDQEIKIMQQEVMEEVFEKYYENEIEKRKKRIENEIEYDRKEKEI